MKAIVIPADPAKPVEEIELEPGTAGRGQLDQLQGLVDGFIEALPLPDFIPGAREATAYVNEEGKYLPRSVDGEMGPGAPNMRATDFMVPGSGLRWGDYIAGTFVIVGFDPRTGEHTEEIPDGVVRRALKIEKEASI